MQQPTTTSRFWRAVLAIAAVALIAAAVIFALRLAAPDVPPADTQTPEGNLQTELTTPEATSQ